MTLSSACYMHTGYVTTHICSRSNRNEQYDHFGGNAVFTVVITVREFYAIQSFAVVAVVCWSVVLSSAVLLSCPSLLWNRAPLSFVLPFIVGADTVVIVVARVSSFMTMLLQVVHDHELSHEPAGLSVRQTSLLHLHHEL